MDDIDHPKAPLTANESASKSRHVSLEMERRYFQVLVGPELRPVLGMVLITLTVGTLFYRFVEGWGLLDSLYFSVVTLATIGFGDISPLTRVGKIFTIAYIFAGVGTLGLFLSTVASSTMKKTLEDGARELEGTSASEQARQITANRGETCT